PTNCAVDELFWMNDTLVAATYGRGMFSINITGGGCTYSLSSTSQNFASAGGSSSITVGGQTFTVSQGAPSGCPAAAITPGQTISASLTTSDCIFTGTTRYVDVYEFNGTAGQQVAVLMDSSVFDTY